jgi:undecaprenyl-diphosphatase
MPEADVAPTRASRRAQLSDANVLSAIAWLVGGILVLLIFGLVVGLAVVGRHGGGAIQGWDVTVGNWFLHHRAHLVSVSKFIAFVGDAPFLGAISVVLTIALLLARQRVRAFIPLVAYLGGEFLVYVIRAIIHRQRPLTANFPALHAIPGVHETSYSYPSGHATAATAVLFGLAGLAVMTWNVWWPWLLASVLTVAVACSRLVLGVHWFSDVAFGLIMGVCWGVIVSWALRDVRWPHPLGGHESDPEPIQDRV